MALLLQIKDLPEGNSLANFSCAAEDLPLDYSDVHLAEALKVSADLTQLHDQTLFRGRIMTVLRLSCSRCAEDFERPLDSELVFVLKYAPFVNNLPPEENESEDYFILPEGTPEFDFSELVREKIILSVEMKPLCRTDCRGLCPICGANLNQTSCDCRREEIDERWLPLKNLKNQKSRR
jgi:uncharacterized protein